MDTVPPTAPLEPVLVDDGWENAGDGILGADNKAAVAALVELARLLTSADLDLEIGIELLFTIAEETGLHGRQGVRRRPVAQRLRLRLRPCVAVRRDRRRVTHPHAVGGRDSRSSRPCGSASGARGERDQRRCPRGDAAMPQGRLDPETTANVGTIAGGTATQRRSRSMPVRGRGPRARPGSGRRRPDRVDRRGPGRGRPGRLRPGPRGRADVHRLPAAAARAIGRGRRAGALRRSATSRVWSPAAAAPTRMRSGPLGFPARTSPTGPSARTNPESVSASSRSRPAWSSPSHCWSPPASEAPRWRG